jgi:hypothetical protein
MDPVVLTDITPSVCLSDDLVCAWKGRFSWTYRLVCVCCFSEQREKSDAQVQEPSGGVETVKAATRKPPTRGGNKVMCTVSSSNEVGDDSFQPLFVMSVVFSVLLNRKTGNDMFDCLRFSSSLTVSC